MVDQLVDGLREISKTPLKAVVFDVRGNAAGFMPVGVDAAKLFPPPNAKVIAEVNKSQKAKIYLYILVDSLTASASEIFTAALQDNEHATVVGTSKTFGKGRIQNFQGPLLDGSGLSVTKAKYMTPNGHDIQGIGITPDIKLLGDKCTQMTMLPFA